MTAYLLLLILSSLFLVLGGIYIRARKYCFFCVIMIFSMFSGLRKDVGVDYDSYLDLFNSVKLGYQVPMEVGYQLLMKIIVAAGGVFQLLVLVSSLATNILIGLFLYRSSSYPAFSAFIYLTLSIYYLASFTAMRQFIAVAIFAYSIRYIMNKQFIKYCVLLALGSTIHVTLILMIPFYFLLNRSFKLWQYLGMVMIYVLSVRLIDIFIFWFGFSDLYLINDDDSPVSPVLLVFTIIGAGLVLFRKKLISFDPGLQVFINLIFFSLLVVLTILISGVQGVIVLRMSSYFTIAYLIVIPALVNLIKNRSVKIVYIIVVTILFSGYYVLTVGFNGVKYSLTPYHINLSIF